LVVKDKAGKYLQYNGKEIKNVPVPKSVWITHLKENPGGGFSIKKTNIHAMNSLGLMNESCNLYSWPYPNHSVSYGVCWGNDPVYKSLASNVELSNLSSLFSIYFSANFNEDLGFKFNIPETEYPSFSNVSGLSSFEDSFLRLESRNLRETLSTFQI